MNAPLEFPDPFPQRRAQFGQLPGTEDDEDDQDDDDQMPRLEDAFKHLAPPTGTGGGDSPSDHQGRVSDATVAAAIRPRAVAGYVHSIPSPAGQSIGIGRPRLQYNQCVTA